MPITKSERTVRTSDHMTTAELERRQLIRAGVFALVMALFFLVLPMLYRAHYDLLLWSEGFMERAFASSFVTGERVKLIETPKPLWNLFWLLAGLPNQLYWVICLLIGGIFLLYPLISDRLCGSIIPGIVAALVTVFAFKEVLVLFLSGNWTIPYLFLGLLFLFALLSQRWIWASLAAGLASLIRPETWLLAAFLPVYVRYRPTSPAGGQPTNLRWYLFAPLGAPLLWLLYDYRLSGDWLYSFRNTAAYAVLTGIPGTGFLTYWPELILDIADSTGIVVLGYAVVGIVLRSWHLARETKARKSPGWRYIVFDPLLAVTLLPFIASWIMSLQGDIIVMRRFFYLSVGLLALYSTLSGWLLFRKIARYRSLWALATLAPLLLVSSFRLPTTFRDGLRSVKVTEAKMAAIPELAAQLVQMSEARPADSLNGGGSRLDEYRYIFIPFRRYAHFQLFTNEAVSRKLISYREVSLAVTSTQALMLGEAVQPPKNAPRFVRDLMLGGKRFADFLPALAVWIPDDEMHYIDAFAFDHPEYFHKNYIDKGRYGFRIIGSALDSLGLIYDVREVSPEQLQIPAPLRTDE